MQRLILMNRIRKQSRFILLAITTLALLWVKGNTLEAQTTVTRLFEEAEQLMERGRYKQAIEKYDSVILFQTTNPKLYYNRSLGYINLQKYGEALVDLNKCLSLDTAFYDAYFNRAYVHNFMNNTAFALGDYNIYLEKNPLDYEARLARGKLLLEQNELGLAIKDIDVYTQKFNDNDDAYVAKFFAYKALNKSAESLAAIDSALAIKPLSSKYHKLKADYLFDLGQYADACISYDKAISSYRSNTELYTSKAEAKYKLGLFNDAVEAIDRAIDYKGGDPNFYYDKAFYLLQGKRYEESNLAIKEAIRLHYSDSATAFFIQAINFNNLGYAEDACLNFKKAHKLGKSEAKEYAAKLCDD